MVLHVQRPRKLKPTKLKKQQQKTHEQKKQLKIEEHKHTQTAACRVMMIWLLEMDSAMMNRKLGLVRSSVVT